MPCLEKGTPPLPNSDDTNDEEESSRASSTLSEKFPEVFVEAIRQTSITSLTIADSSSYTLSEYGTTSTSGSETTDSNHAPKSEANSKHRTLIPECVLAALTNIQRSQLRRIREEATHTLDLILRNVVKTVDQYNADQLSHEMMMSAKRMIGEDEADEEEKRIKDEVRKILKGEIKWEPEPITRRDTYVATRRMTVASFPEQSVRLDASVKPVTREKAVRVGKPVRPEKPGMPNKPDQDDKSEKVKDTRAYEMGEEEKEVENDEMSVVTQVGEESEIPVCQVMLNIIDDLNENSNEREDILNEVLQWMEGHQPDPFANYPLSFEKEDLDLEKFLQSITVHKKIRRLSLLSEELGLSTHEEVIEKVVEEVQQKQEKTVDNRKKRLEEKMNKHRSKYIATKVFDAETLSDPRNWMSASRAISQVFEEAERSTTSPRSKQTYANAQKQFQFMTSLAEKRQEEKTKLSVQVNDLVGKLNKEKKEAKSLRKQKQALESQMEKHNDESQELKKELEVRDKMIKEHSVQIYELELMQEEAEERRKQDATNHYPPPPQQQAQQMAASKSKESAALVTKTSKLKTTTAGKQPKAKAPQASQGTKPHKGNKDELKKLKQEKEKEETAKGTVIMSLKEAKAELEEIRQAGEAREKEIKELKMKLELEAASFEKETGKLLEEIQFHKSQTDTAKKQLEIEQEAWDRIKNEMTQEKDKLSNEVQAKEEIINYQDQRIQEVAREMTLSLVRAGLQTGSSGRGNATDKLMESKQMLAKIHLQYEYEMQRLREFVNRESERHQAEMRRLDQEHRRNLQLIYKDNSVIFRAVNRFKECLAVLLDRENLADAAFGVRNLANLFDDENVTDPHLKLARMAGSVTELMVQMEFKISQALMNKRMEIKDNSLAKNFLSKDLETREELLKKARELGNLQAEKLKHVREELSSQEVEFLKLKHSEEVKYLDMTEKNKDLTRQNQILNKELTALKKELDEEAIKNETRMEEIEKTTSEMRRRLEQQEVIISNLKAENARIVGEQKLHLKKSDMMRNIKLLNDALAANKISEEKHMVAMTMIEKTMEVSGLRFVHLVRKYVLHRSWKKICEAMIAFHKSNKRPPKVEKYLKNMERRMKQQRERWKERKEELLKKKTELYMHFKHMCNELNKEHGIHLIRPTVQKVSSAPSLPEAELVGTQKPQYYAKMIPRKATADIGSIAEVKGFKFVTPLASYQESWAFPPIQATHSSIVTPKILDMEIKKARETYQRVLTSKSCEHFDKDNLKNRPHHRQLKEREALFSLPPIASLYPEG